LRARELRDLTDEELDNRLADTRQELFNLRFQGATGALENTARLKLAKREIARILSIRNERASRLTSETHG
jgi:large subunit ribosomal protein L29